MHLGPLLSVALAAVSSEAVVMLLLIHWLLLWLLLFVGDFCLVYVLLCIT